MINALTDETIPVRFSPTFTVKEYSGKVEGVKLVFYGDGQSNINYQCRAADQLRTGDRRAGRIRPALRADPAARPISAGEADPLKAAKDADYVYTDVWSAWDSKRKAHRLQVFAPHQINMDVIPA